MFLPTSKAPYKLYVSIPFTVVRLSRPCRVSRFDCTVMYMLFASGACKDTPSLYLKCKLGACRDTISRCIKLAMTPILNQMSVVGIVAIPGDIPFHQSRTVEIHTPPYLYLLILTFIPIIYHDLHVLWDTRCSTCVEAEHRLYSSVTGTVGSVAVSVVAAAALVSLQLPAHGSSIHFNMPC